MQHQLAVFALAGLLACGAQATTTNWGNHDALELGAAVTPVGIFDDQFMFTLSGPDSLFSTAVSNNLTNMLGISGGVVSLYSDTGVVKTLLGSYLFDDDTGNISHGFGVLGAGSYFYSVSGTGTGSLGGFYTISSTVSAVPEPQSLALLLGGLGAIAFVVRRRSV